MGAVFAFFLTVGLYISGVLPFLAALSGFFISSSIFTKLRAEGSLFCGNKIIKNQLKMYVGIQNRQVMKVR
ncbi:hypothetical protein [Desulfosporosinus acididurans]|uniref:hypothetical protein n=1 Tax=Desulfosporosinus acididurans TaxID=476652 RepID=UPI00064958F4|nr:hypothetical protein [Desulfosporosinus acididurans]